MWPIFVGSADNSGNRYEKKIRSRFDQRPQLYLSLNAKPETQILNYF